MDSLLLIRLALRLERGETTPALAAKRLRNLASWAADDSAVNAELLAALEDMRRWAIPGMNWTDDTGLALLAQADAAIAKARYVVQIDGPHFVMYDMPDMPEGGFKSCTRATFLRWAERETTPEEAAPKTS